MGSEIALGLACRGVPENGASRLVRAPGLGWCASGLDRGVAIPALMPGICCGKSTCCWLTCTGVPFLSHSPIESRRSWNWSSPPARHRLPSPTAWENWRRAAAGSSLSGDGTWRWAHLCRPCGCRCQSGSRFRSISRQRITAPPRPRTSVEHGYRARRASGRFNQFVARGEDRADCQVFSWALRQDLPSLPVPLCDPDPDIVIDLSPVFARAYERGRFHRRINYRVPPPVLRGEDRQWAEAIVNDVGSKDNAN